MKVNFYTFDKKYNSTKRPTGTGTEYNCVLKTSSGVISPTIELQLGLSSNPSAFNYCYISSYARYYWIKEWTFVGHLWIATLNVDVLATWKTYIGSTNMYVYRASAESDGKLLDTKYTTIADVTVSKRQISAVNKKFSEGFFVLGVYGNSTNNTTMAYYVIKGTDFGTFIDEIYTKGIMDDNIWMGNFNLGTFPLAIGIRNAIFDISTYIKSLMWFPYDPSGLNTSSPDIQVGGLTITCPNYKLNDYRAGAFSVPSGMITIPKHPQSASRGVYCNLKPYSRYKLTYLPFGVFELDSTVVGLYTYLFMTVFVDGITGKAVLSVFVSNDNQGSNAVLLLTADAKYGVDIPISVSQTNIPSVASSLAGAGISGIHGNVWSAGVSAISAVAEMASPALVPVSNSQGSVIGINYQNNRLQCTFYTIADEDVNSNGRPLCKIRKPSNLGGYIEGESTDFSAPATITEMEEIKQFIDNGFYYE